MKKFSLFLIPILIGTMIFVGCGKNEKKTALLTGSDTGNGAGTNTTAVMSKQSATMALSFASMGATYSPHLAPAKKQAGEIPTQDNEGFYDFSTQGMTIKVKFLNADGSTATMMGWDSAKLQVKISATYSYGTFSGDFTVDNVNEKMSGTITSSDPIGGTFTATLTDITYDKSGTTGIPTGGTMTISGSSGYSGIFTFGKSGTTYTCDGTISYGGQQVATVNLTYDATGKYTGYYTDGTGTHPIS
ncbi:MAG: hypothetical protein HY919_05870 [Elusimicrobia bacterium]|nr:hypothetical protein [Elusimicrobiota bacterium]